METTDKEIVRMLAELCVAHGVTEVVLSPGSRNAPLSVAFNRMQGLNCRVVVDERSAGFFALGEALATHRPVVVVCTSGTALLDLSPAVAEAYYQSIPLIVISADRPQAWINQNDSQTIRQEGALSNFVKRSYQLPMSETPDDLWYANRLINDALIEAQRGRRAPVHINVPLAEPLYGLRKVEAAKARVVRYATSQYPLHLQSEVVDYYAQQINRSKRVMVLLGFMPCDDSLRKQIARMVAMPSVVVVAEPISNQCSSETINQPELFFSSIGEAEEADFVPDILITAGGALVSKSAKKFFRKHAPLAHWHVGEEEWTIDTFRCLTDRIDVAPSLFFEQLAEKIEFQKSDYAQCLRAQNEEALRLQSERLATAEWSEEVVFEQLIQGLPQNVALFLSNGLSVRLGQRFSWKQDIRFFANRGTSGIDGSSSTDVGYSVASKEFTVLVSGDISFLYDSNALWNNYLSPQMRIVVINNGGGGIFRRLPGPPTLAEMEDYFETPHNVDIAALAKAYGVDYMKADSRQTLLSALQSFFSPSERARILEVVV